MPTDPPSTVQSFDWLAATARGGAHLRLGLVWIWSLEEPTRAGEVVFPPSGGGVLGRGADTLELLRQRPGDSHSTGPMGGRTASRQQLALRAGSDGLEVQNLGRVGLRIRGVTCAGGIARPGDLVTLDRHSVFMVVERPQPWPAPTTPLRSTC